MYEALLLLLLVFTPLAHGTVEIWAVTVLHVISVIICTLWVLSMIHRGQLILRRTPVDLPAMIFVSLACLSVLFSVYPYATRIQLYRIINYAVIFYIVINTISSDRQLLRLVWGIAIFGGLYAMAGLTLVGEKFMGFRIFSPGQYNISLTFVNPNHFAGYMEIIALICTGLALAYNGGRRILFIFFAVFASVAVFFSLSRGGALSLLGGLFFLFTAFSFCKGRRRDLWLLASFFVLTLLVVAWLGLEPVLENLRTLKTPLLEGKSRFEVWKGALNLIADNPWFGTGLGTFVYVFPRYQTEHMIYYSTKHAHNDYLELAVEMGVPGILAVLLCIAVLFTFVLKRLVVLSDRRLQAVGLGALAGCFSLLLHGLTDFNFHIPSNALLFVVCAAIVLISTKAGNSRIVPTLINIKLLDKLKLPVYCAILILSVLALAMVISPYLGSVYLKEAKRYQDSKTYELAATAIKKAIGVDPGNAEHLVAMGDLMVASSTGSSGTIEREAFLHKSLKYYNDAIKASPVNGYYYKKRAFVLQRLGNQKEAEEALSRAIYFNPTDSFSHYELGELYLEQGRLDKAIQEYKKFIHLEGDYKNLYKILYKIWGTASQDYKDLRQVVPDDVEMVDAFANFLLEVGLHSEAINTLQTELRHSPNDAGLYLGLAIVYIKLKRYSEAISTLKKGLEYKPDNGKLHYFMAYSYRRMGRHDNALESLKKAVSLKPENAQYRYELGVEFRIKGLYSKATEQWEKCLEINPEHNLCKRDLRRIHKEFGITESEHGT